MGTMKLSDWVAEKIAALGVLHVFMVTGGGAMHLNHSFGTHPNLECVFNHHEQACAMAAEAYHRLTNRVALVNVTSGPGGSNAITGVYGAYVDSIAMVVLSGQVKFETTVRATGLALRQFGDQELDIEALVRPITKYAHMVTDPRSIRYHLEKAFYLAKSGRPGPVWLDIPLDVQGARIDPDTLPGFDPAELDQPWKETDLSDAADKILARIRAAERPVIFAGGGVRLSGAHESFLRFIENVGAPVVTGWNAHDVLPNDHPLYCGRPGTVGDRGGNFTVQNADLLLIVGSRLNIRQVSYNWQSFAREAFKIWIDIDPLELQKPNVKPDMPILADLADLLPTLSRRSYPGPTDAHLKWLEWARERNRRFPTVLPEYWDNRVINPYCFVHTLFEHLPENQIVITANGSACVIGFQAANLKKGQRLWTNSGCASMGYDLPAAIGAQKASGETIVTLAGDGSIMMNLQELQTIAGYGLPIKIFILNNNGYVSIFQTQRSFFDGVEVGASQKSGVCLPDFARLVPGFGLPFRRCDKHEDMAAAIEWALAVPGPAVCEMILDENVAFAPKLNAKSHADGQIISSPLEDLSPFLPREEFAENMLVPMLDCLVKPL